MHERQPAGITHLHNDTVPPIGGDTLWASGYGAYEKLSPEFRKFIDGRQAVYRSAHQYLDREDPTAGPRYIERTHPLVRVHPATGWRALWVNRAMTLRIVGLDKAESDDDKQEEAEPERQPESPSAHNSRSVPARIRAQRAR